MLYSRTVVHQLLPPDSETRINYRWFQQSVYDGMVDPDIVFRPDEAWFHLSGYVNSRTIATGVQKIHTPFMRFHYMKIGVRCVISVHRIIEPVCIE
jgi:hypothetical protein